jgi:hypothetical protein
VARHWSAKPCHRCWPAATAAIARKQLRPTKKAAGVRIVAEYRQAEQTAIDNEVALARARVRNPECDAFEAQRIRR